MKTWTLLAAAAVLTIGAAAHADEPLRLDTASLDRVTAGERAFFASAYTFGGFARAVPLNGGGAGAFGEGSLVEESSVRGFQRTTPSGSHVSLRADARGMAAATGRNAAVEAATGGGVSLFNSP